MKTQNQLITEAVDKLSTLRWELSKIKDQAMDQDMDHLASELNAITYGAEVNERRLKNLLIKFKK